jgi:hypothetical protein
MIKASIGWLQSGSSPTEMEFSSLQFESIGEELEVGFA